MIMAVLCSIPSILIILPVLLIAVDLCSGLAEKASPPSVWRPLPHPLHFDRREILVSGAALAATGSFPKQAAAAAAAAAATNPRTAAKTQSHLVIPVWPSWGGGRVVPVSLAREADPFLLLAHHKHWFDPNDPLREPFKDVGKALGLPYVDVEGFKMHPHRGMDVRLF